MNLCIQAMDAAKVEDHIKECWTIVLKGDNALLREWISRCLDWSQPLPSVEYQVCNNGFVALGPFLSQVNEMIRVAPMPAQDTLIDQFALRGVIFPRDLPEGVAAPGAPALDREGAGDDSAPGAAQGATETDFSRLLVRLSKCNLLFRPLDLSGNVRLTLDTLLPYEVEAPFHHFMVRHCLEHDLQPVLEAYTVWHNLHKCSFDTFYPVYKKTASSTGYACVLLWAGGGIAFFCPLIVMLVFFSPVCFAGHAVISPPPYSVRHSIPRCAWWTACSTAPFTVRPP